MSTALVILLAAAGVPIIWALVRAQRAQAGSRVIVRCGEGHCSRRSGSQVCVLQGDTIWHGQVPVVPRRQALDDREPGSRIRLPQEGILHAYERHDIRIP
jgi:hypothetical protein